jgi:hypothetical protein
LHIADLISDNLPMNPATTDKQIRRVREQRQKMVRLGLPLFVLTRGTILLLWMCLCFVGMMYLYGRQRLLHQAFVLESTLPCTALLAYLMPLAQYWMVRQMVRRMDSI